MKFKKIISITLAALFIFNSSVFASDTKDGEVFKFIVELKESPVIEDVQEGELKAFAASGAAEKGPKVLSARKYL